MVKYSIIIPTAFDHLEKDLKPCIESILKYTDLTDVEVIVVSNGCTDTTDAYVQGIISGAGDKFKLLSFPEALGYPKAVNKGIDVAMGEYIVFLNNDVILLEQPKNQWLDYLVEPFIKDPLMGVTGTRKNYHMEAGREFIVFYCAMTTSALANRFRLNEEYGVGTCDDVEFCIEVENAGYKLATVPLGHPPLVTLPGQPVPTSSFPLYHLGGSTMYSLRSNDYHKNALSIAKKYNPSFYEQMIRPKVLAFVPTKDRYDSLALTLHSIATQTVTPDALWIYDDGECRDLREAPLYKPIFALLSSRGVDWKVIFGAKKGQHHGHQLANTSQYPLVWRLDDDEVAESTTLARLLAHMKDGVGAVAGAVYTPGDAPPKGTYGKIEDIFHTPNVQWCPDAGVFKVEHLYSSFLYRSNQVDYDLWLSPVAHREETLFSHALFRKGLELIVDTSIKTYHYRHPHGGIRSHASAFLYEHDNKRFLAAMEEWGIKVISLNGGLGDHLAFLNVVPALLAKYNKLIIGCCNPEVFKDYARIKTIPVAATKDFTDDDVYKFMIDNKWTTSIVDAYKKMFKLNE